jgi:NAD(P)-dependent dehydrogenase (short-subunit alcohol dehydrogenase family)
MMTANRPVALVTGASSGIGKAAALALAAAGFQVVGTSRNSSLVAPGNGVIYLDLDVTNDESVSAVVKQVIERFGRVDVLINNAGVGAAGAAEESSVAQAQSVFDVNVFGLIRMTKAILPHMRAQGRGRIINISSVLGFLPQPYMAVYAASKHAIEGYTESLDHEVRDHGIRALIIEPAYTRTGFEANSAKPDTPLHAYARQRLTVDRVMAEAVRGGDAPAVVAKAVVAAATDAKPKLRYAAGPLAGRARLLRFVPAWVLDKQIRSMNKLAG